MLHTFIAFAVINGQMRKIDHLGHFELDDWMAWAYGKFSAVKVERDDGKVRNFVDDGKYWSAA